jgi:hypothetical protein
LPGAHQDAALARAQREDMPGTREVCRIAAGVDGDTDGLRAVRRRDASGDALAGLDALGEGGPEARGILLRHRRQAKIVGALLGEGEADEAAAVTGHEIDRLGSDKFSGDGQVAFVFAVFIIDYHDHAAGLNLGNGAGDIGERRVRHRFEGLSVLHEGCRAKRLGCKHYGAGSRRILSREYAFSWRKASNAA